MVKLNKMQDIRVRVTRNNILVTSRTNNFSSRDEIRSWVNKELRFRFPNKKVNVNVVNGDTCIHWVQIVG